MIASFHSPLNISLLTTAPLGWFLNSKSIWNQYTNLFCLINRVPILLYEKTNKTWLITNFRSFFKTKQTILNQAFENTDILNGQEGLTNLFKSVANEIIGERNVDEPRTWLDDERNNAVYIKQYVNGQFTGMISPQANDFYQDNNENNKSDFNQVSLIKCLFQLAMLGSVFSSDWQFYTLTNVILFINYDERSLKFTGKYWYKSSPKLNDEKETPKTIGLINRIMKRIEIDDLLSQKIKEEIGLEGQQNVFKAVGGNRILEKIKDEDTNEIEIDNKELKASLELSKKLFLSTTGLENFLKEHIALSFSGILGHSWDNLLRYFQPSDDKKKTQTQIEAGRSKYPTFNLFKHMGTPIASYLLDLRDENTQNDGLQGYNSLNFGKILNENILSLSDGLKAKTVYKPLKTPNCLIPITFAPTLLQCKTKCYRNYKRLLKLMKTRKQREFLFDNLTHFGRRVMTVLDPYGIFMYFHNDQKGLAGN